MANFGPLAAEIGSGVWAPQQISTGFASWLRTELCTMFGRLLGCYTIYTCTFSEALPDGISPRANFTLRPSLAFSYIGIVTAQHSNSGVSQTVWCGTRNGITELSQRAPPIFGWAAITLGIGPHSSVSFYLGHVHVIF